MDEDETLAYGSLGEVGFGVTREERAAYFRAYFRFLNAELRNSFRLTAVPADKHDDDVPASLIEDWKAWLPLEVKALTIRNLQAPKEVVKRTWYNSLEEFDSFAATVWEIVSTTTTAELERVLDSKWPINVEEELAFSRLTEEAVGALSSVPCGSEGSSWTSSVVSERLQLAEAAVVEALCDDLSTPTDFESALSVALSALAEIYEVAVCDFLTVTSARTGKSTTIDQLELSATTWREHDLSSVRGSESAYRFAGGITGSAFLLDRSVAAPCVITNDLDFDPRQSTRHTREYKQVYPQVRAFCVVPVYRGDEMLGVVRFINPVSLGEGAGRRGTWPLETRLEFFQICQRLGLLLPILQVAVPGGPNDSVLSQLASYKNLLPWTESVRYTAAILRDCARIASMKDEHRTVSATLIIGSAKGCRAFEEKYKEHHPSVPASGRKGSITQAGGLFRRVLPGTGVFVCGEGETKGLYPQLHYSSVKAIKVFSVSEAVALVGKTPEVALVHIKGDQSLVRIYAGGEWSVDYYLNERTGSWEIRSRSDLAARIQAWVDSPSMAGIVADVVLDLCIEYSYEGHGGLVLISEKTPSQNVASKGFAVNRHLRDLKAGEATFSAMASVDGGMWIRTDGFVVFAGAIFEAKGSSERQARTGGARHQAAQSLARAVPKGVVCAISANRPITLFFGDRHPLVL